jgi:dTDP-4-dehydrorhamnose 3,5-epimerase-like enzyme
LDAIDLIRKKTADFIFVGAPLYVDSRGFFTRLWPSFADSVFVDSPLYVDSRGFFTRLWPPFADSAYVDSLFYVDFVSVGMPLYVDTFGVLCVC